MEDIQVRIKPMIDTAWDTRRQSPQRSLYLSEYALSLLGSVIPDDAQERRLIYRNLAWLHECLADYETALDYAHHALNAFQQAADHQNTALIYNLIGIIQRRLGNYPEAINHHFRALKTYTSLDATAGQADAYLLISQVRSTLGHYQTAEIDARRSLALYRQADDGIGQAHAFNAIATARLAQNQPAKALDFALQSWEIYCDLNHRLGEAEVMITIGAIYHAQGDADSAENCLNASIIICNANGYQFQLIQALMHLGQINQQRRHSNAAHSYLNHALMMADEIGSKWHTMTAHQHLAALKKDEGNFEQALHHFEHYHHTQGALYGEQVAARIKEMETQHALEIAEIRNNTLYDEIERRKEAEHSLQRLNKQLHQEIARREQLTSDLDAYAHTVAHDLKHPLAVIAAYVDLLDIDLSDSVSAESKGWLRDLRKVTLKMGQIIDELLLLAGEQHDELMAVPLDMYALIADAKMRLGHLSTQYNAQIVINGELPEALGHAPWIEEVWVNYISNAIKYGGMPPVIEIGADILETGKVTYWVKDNGDGLSKDQQHQLFMPFKRLEGDTTPIHSQRQRNGHGLGLSIVRRIVTRLGGEVQVKSDGIPGNGCVFSFTLPGVPVEV